MAYKKYTPSDSFSQANPGKARRPNWSRQQPVQTPNWTRQQNWPGTSSGSFSQGANPSKARPIQTPNWSRQSKPQIGSGGFLSKLQNSRNTSSTSGGSNANNRVSAGAAGSTGASFDYGGFERRKRDIYDRSARDSIQNAYGRFISQQRGARDLGDMQRQFGYNTPSFLASFAQRGIGGPGIRSGIETEQKDRFFGSYARDRGRLAQDITQQLQQFDLNQAEIDAMRQNALAQLEADKANEIAMTAENLEFLRQMIGGL